MTERNQKLIADLQDGPLSNYEMAIWQDCISCAFGDTEKIEQMKILQEKKAWLEMSNISGWCLFSFKKKYDTTTEPWTCLNWKLQKRL